MGKIANQPENDLKMLTKRINKAKATKSKIEAIEKKKVVRVKNELVGKQIKRILYTVDNYLTKKNSKLIERKDKEIKFLEEEKINLQIEIEAKKKKAA
jgi:hypothetical protein